MEGWEREEMHGLVLMENYNYVKGKDIRDVGGGAVGLLPPSLPQTPTV